MFYKKQLALSIVPLMAIHTYAWADENKDTKPLTLSTLVVTAQDETLSALPLADGRKASDVIIKKEVLQNRSALLGDALAGQVGIHSNPFGGGASSPIIRGQEGVRIKILQNGTDVADMSQLSPDHAAATDTMLASQVEVIRGTPTLLYAGASAAGVVNVVDNRIPSKLPDNGATGELAFRHNTNSHEKLATVGVTTALGQHIALRFEGLTRNANHYHVKHFNLGSGIDYVPDTFNKSHVGTVGVSWVGDKGYLGAAYSLRQDKYGLPGHNHDFDGCSGHIMTDDAKRPYLRIYPHLMQEDDISYSPHFHCGGNHVNDPNHSHDHPYGHNHDHTHPGPWVELVSKRLDVRGQLNQPFTGIDSIKLAVSQSNYHHDELDAGKSGHKTYQWQKDRVAKLYGKPDGIFDNQGITARLDFVHAPWGGLTGTWGLQYQKYKTSATNPNYQERLGGYNYAFNALVENSDKRLSVFGLEQLRVKNWLFELGARYERQRIHIDYDTDAINALLTPQPNCILPGFCLAPAPVDYDTPNLSDYRQNAFSYSGTALWDINDKHRLSFTYSHNERLPAPAELYYHGKHLATNSFEYGRIDLKKEKSNNFEIGLSFKGDKLDYKISTYYNKFDNYLYKENLYRSGNLFMRRQNQGKADFYGLEGEIGYQFLPNHKVTLFGDVVQGRLHDVKPDFQKVITGYNPYTLEENYEYQRVGEPYSANAPRVPPARLGLKLDSYFGDHWSSSLDYTRVFQQNRTAKLEYATEGYHMLNAGLNYQNTFGAMNYKISLNANNLLNQDVYIHTSFLPYVPQMGRSFSIGVNISF